MTKNRRILLSVVVGVALTIALAWIGFTRESRPQMCGFVWQACLTMSVYHPPDMPDGRVMEGTPADPLIFFFGLSLGIPIYGGLTYAALSLAAKSKRRPQLPPDSKA
jgi:Na+/H+ antiporter NhaD/arsenite permease-like protein